MESGLPWEAQEVEVAPDSLPKLTSEGASAGGELKERGVHMRALCDLYGVAEDDIELQGMQGFHKVASW